MDVALLFESNRFDVALDGAALKPDNGLRTAVMLSLFIDRRANADDVILDGTTNRRGWWADTNGSRLWLLSREKETGSTLQRARDYALEALQWLIDDGIASSVDVQAEWAKQGVLGLLVTIKKADGSRFEELFNYSLEVI